MGIDPLDKLAAESTASGNGHPHGIDAAESGGAHVPVHYAPKTRGRVIVFASAVAIGLLVIFLVVHHLNASADEALENDKTAAAGRVVPVDVVRVHHADADSLLTLPGDARPFYETTIFGRTNGYVSKWLVDIGDNVKENQLLATIETPELDDQLHESKANLAQLQAQANVAGTNARFAKITDERWEAAAPEGAVSKQERDEKKAELDSALAKLEAAKSAVNLAQAQVQRLQTLEKFKQVVAPFDGVITQRLLDIGSLVTAGSTTNTTPLYMISQSNRMRVFVDVPQPAVPDIRVGMRAKVKARELPGEIFEGGVDRTASSIDPKSRTLKVEVLVENAKLVLLPGMYVQVTFETNRINPPLRIPAAALAFGANGPQVAVVADDGRLTFRPITIARDMGDAVEVGSGLVENEMVALNVGSQVVSGEKVDPHLIDVAPAAAPPKAVANVVPAPTAAAIAVH
jgi:RND family efflux transporter MFP subunit